jgi:hypothetical protein
MALDVQPITGTSAAVAARLCNFVTAHDYLLKSHMDWLDANIPPAIKDLQTPWVDLIGYASRKGNDQFNHDLSFRRCESVKKWVANYSDRLNFQMEWAKGSSESTGERDDDSGYWRAVEIYIYGHRPPKIVPPPAPHPATVTKFWNVRVVGGTSIAPPALKGGQSDSFFFQIVDRGTKQTAFFLYIGGGLAIPTVIPSPPMSVTKMGDWSKQFKTVGVMELPDFVGAAQLFQDPGATAGPLSVGGDMHLSFDSDTITRHGTLVVPHIVQMPSGSGISLSAGSVTKGKLILTGGVMPFSDPLP